MDMRDIALQATAPTLMVPLFGELDPIQGEGHRFLAARDGLWLDIKREWLEFRLPLARQQQVAMPYGMLDSKIEFMFGKLPTTLIQEFVTRAKQVAPDECAGWIVWDAQLGSFRLVMLENISAGLEHVTFHRPRLGEHEHLVVDIHSHGTLKAFFSEEDNLDDAGEVKISVVVGNLDQEKQTIRARLCAMGMFVVLPTPCLQSSGGI